METQNTPLIPTPIFDRKDDCMVLREFYEFVDMNSDGSFFEELWATLHPLYEAVQKAIDTFLMSDFFDRYVSSVLTAGVWRSPVGFLAFYVVGFCLFVVASIKIAALNTFDWKYFRLIYPCISCVLGGFAAFLVATLIRFGKIFQAQLIGVAYLVGVDILLYPWGSYTLYFHEIHDGVNAHDAVLNFLFSCIACFAELSTGTTVLLYGPKSFTVSVVYLLSIQVVFNGFVRPWAINCCPYNSSITLAIANFFATLAFVYVVVRIHGRLGYLASERAAPSIEFYNSNWKKIKENNHVEDFQALRSLWIEVMMISKRDGKIQRIQFPRITWSEWFCKPKNIAHLFHEARQLHPIYKRKLEEWCNHLNLSSDEVISFYMAPVKSSQRAIEKAYRSYGGDFRKLCDLLRGSIICSSIQSLTRVLQVLATDPSVAIIYPGDDSYMKKFRLDNTKDFSDDTLGYRDIQLSIQFSGHSEAQSLGVHNHICELQLHMHEIFNAKEFGHAAYKKWRNLKGH